MLQEEVSELEHALGMTELANILTESVDVLCLTLNLTQECGLEGVVEDTDRLKHSDSTRKQHETTAQLSQTKTACARSRTGKGKDMDYQMARAPCGKWPLYSRGKLVKP